MYNVNLCIICSYIFRNAQKHVVLFGVLSAIFYYQEWQSVQNQLVKPISDSTVHMYNIMVHAVWIRI